MMSSMSPDFLIRGARVIDGTGSPWFVSDVRVKNGRIQDIQKTLASDGADIVEADGRYLAPGFIDAHCHDDLICLREPDRPEKALQGVTTVVVGNCSFSLYPATSSSAPALRQHFSSLLGEVLPDEVFDSFADYRNALHDRGIAVNVVSLVGHAALRIAVLGHERRSATEAERARMQELLAAQLRDGAAGLSLGLVYPPSAYADQAELLELSRIASNHGKLVAAHIRSYEGELSDSIDEFIGLLKGAGAPGLLSHLQSAGRPNWGKIPSAIGQLERARQDGVDVSFDMYPYPAGSSYMLQLLPPETLEGGVDVLIEKLAQAGFREQLRRAVEAQGDAAEKSKVAMIGWGNVRISGVSNPSLKQFEGMNMADAAERSGLSPFDLMLRFITEDRGQTTIVMFQLDDADLKAACTHRLHMVGSDGLPRPGTKPHPRAFGTFPRVAGQLRREGWFSLEDAVCRMTSRAAERFGLADRGLVRPGLVADLVLFDDAIEDRATFDAPTELPSGIKNVWVAGEAIVQDGQATGRRPGRVLGH
jgi:N-acyl-D-amino-acid deacylase